MRTEAEWQARERELLEANNRYLERARQAERDDDFQTRVSHWMLRCFGEMIAADRLERCDRFLDEGIELVQAGGYSAERAHALVDYVFSRPVGELGQEIGGVRVTLAALCSAYGIDEITEAYRELDRILAPEIMAKIRAKQAAKPTGSALPVAVADTVEMPSPTQMVRYPNGMCGMAMFHYAAEGHDYGEIAAEHGFDTRILWFEHCDVVDDLQADYEDGAADICARWIPDAPDGWTLAAKHDTDDGPVALFIRPGAAPQNGEDR